MDLTDFKYYWNDVPGKGLCRNNLIYTSLINHSKSEFCMWFKHNSEYHKGHEQVVDQDLMESKYSREKEQWTLDRIDNNIGHTKDNVVISCLSCNIKRGVMDDAKFKFTKQLKIIKKYD